MRLDARGERMMQGKGECKRIFDPQRLRARGFFRGALVENFLIALGLDSKWPQERHHADASS